MINSPKLAQILRMYDIADTSRVLYYDGRAQHQAFDMFSVVTDISVDSRAVTLSEDTLRPWEVNDLDVIYLGRATEHPGPLMGHQFMYGKMLRRVLANTPHGRTWRMRELVDPQTWAERMSG